MRRKLATAAVLCIVLGLSLAAMTPAAAQEDGEVGTFEGVIEDGFLEIRSNNTSEGFDISQEFPKCPEGEAPEGTECVRFTGEVNLQEGTMTVQPEDFHVPTAEVEVDEFGIDTINISMRLMEPATSEIDLQTGEITFNAKLRAFTDSLPSLLGGDCGVTVTIQGTSGESGGMEGEILEVDTEAGTGRLTVVDGEFGIPALDNCNGQAEALSPLLNLPSPAGQNNVSLTIYGEFQGIDLSVLDREPPNFEVTITDTNSPVNEGDALEATADIENTGEFQDTQSISLSIDGNETDSTEITLGQGESESVTLEWSTQSGDNGDYTAEVSSSDTSDTADITVASSGLPGFGFIAGIAALLASLAVVLRRRRK